ncbi:unnamed protein product [Toxocara canis]|uniref:Palmitoyltransferase n=1 Tax=Toxocara canis TaxID=6265 RepID=A0A183UG98_TOXCA|nr:unnamed protein product [Toxocara canis]
MHSLLFGVPCLYIHFAIEMYFMQPINASVMAAAMADQEVLISAAMTDRRFIYSWVLHWALNASVMVSALNWEFETVACLRMVYIKEGEVIEAPDWDSGLERAKGDFGRTMCRRLFHWGPLIAIAITLSVRFSLPIPVCHENICAYKNMGCSIFSMKGMKGEPVSQKRIFQEFEPHLQFCSICDGYKVPRSHHCTRCGRCVLKMDHHCRQFSWINNCVGHRNHAYFVRFLAAAVAGCIHGALIISLALYRAFFRMWYIRHGEFDGPEVILSIYTFITSVFAFGLALGVIVAVGFLLIVQLKSIWKNRTGIEDYIVDKANSYERAVEFFYPYDLGWKRNVREVLGTWNGLPVGDGVWWPIRRPTTQFTFSEEQLMQKRIKRLNAREVRIIRRFEGTCLSALLIGFRVFVCQPCTDERRIPIEVGEHWMVTRVNRHWFYGTKKETEEWEPNGEVDHQAHLKHSHRSPRGWFPRVCAERVQ